MLPGVVEAAPDTVEVEGLGEELAGLLVDGELPGVVEAGELAA